MDGLWLLVGLVAVGVVSGWYLFPVVKQHLTRKPHYPVPISLHLNAAPDASQNANGSGHG